MLTQLNIQVDRPSESTLQATLNQIRGVVDSRIVFGDDHAPSEIHIVATNSSIHLIARAWAVRGIRQ